MSNSKTEAPSEKALNYAKVLASRFKVPLGQEQQEDREACGAFINEWRAVDRKHWWALKKDVRDLAAALPGVVSQAERDSALTSFTLADALRRRCLEEHSEALLAALINGMNQVPAGLFEEILAEEGPEARFQYLRERVKDRRVGYSRIRPDSLHSIQDKLLAYWIEGLQSTAFDSLGNLENCLGKQRHFTSLGAVYDALRNTPMEKLKLDESNPPVRTLVLKIYKPASPGAQEKPPVVIAALPLAAREHSDKSGPGHRWELADKSAPAFNRQQLGPAATIPGLMLEKVEDLDRMIERHLASAARSLDLAGALQLWDRAFDTLVEKWPAQGMAGVVGWLTHFKELAARSRGSGKRGQNPDHVWQVARWQAVFTLVDASAVTGATAAVCNAYRHFLDSAKNLKPRQRALFDSIASLAGGPQQRFDVARVATEGRRILSYFGHMDSRDERQPAQRSAYPLDVAQRDALLALVETGHGGVLAVNGPPGTGKTSLLRGVIASVWVKPLLLARLGEHPECPMIVACAATNQAVTNVISSFNETPGPALFDETGERLANSSVTLESRWLPALTSYGWYAPASLGKNEDDGKKAGHDAFQIIHRAHPGESWSFHGCSERLQSFDPVLLENAWLDCASDHFGQRLSLDKAILRLHRRALEDLIAMGGVQKAAQQWLDCVPRFSLEPGWTDDQEQRLNLLDSELATRALALERVARQVARLRQQNGRLAAIRQTPDRLALVVPSGTDRAPALLQAGALFDHCQARVDALKQAIAGIEQWQARPRPGLSSAIARKLGWDSEQKDLASLRVGLAGLDIEFDPSAPQQTRLVAISRLADESRELQVRAGRVLGLELSLLLGDSCADLLDNDPQALPDDALLEACAVRVCTQLSAAERELARAEFQHGCVEIEQAALEQQRKAWLRNRDAAHGAHASLRKALATAAISSEKIDDRFGIDLHDSPLQEWLLDAIDDDDLDACRRQLVKHVQDLLDTEVRSRLFHLAARYWEGRYLLARRDEREQGKDDPAWRASSARQLRTLAMLAPVFVVTAFSVPKLMRAQLSGFAKGASSYLFGEADLLIVDEAGQGSPEIGAAPFLFARRAIVVGDIEQLEPVWSISAAADGVHAGHYRLDTELAADDSQRSALQRLGDSGNLMSNGSVMRMAQRASAWSDPRFGVKGLTLTNHYRCLKPIIEVCNDLVYHGALVPSRKEPEVASLFRPELKRLACLVVEDAVDTRNPGGSRRNRQEATLIAAWIKENAGALVRHYDPQGKKGLRLKDVVAVITPFTGQISVVQAAMAAAWGFPRFDPKDESQPYHGMTIDTVHSLQGAEKPVVLFSMVESSQPSQAQFYDRGCNLINVAISRAKDLFITAMSQAAVDYARALPDPTSDQARSFKASDYLWHATVHQGSRLNGRHLVLVESPKKCAVIHQALGNSIEWVVCATQGNITGLADARQWSIRDAALPQWQALTPPAEQTLARVARLWPGLQSLYLATDPDTEGEQIAWQLLRILQERVAAADIQGAPAIRRMRFHSLLEQDIRYARDQAGQGLDAGRVKSALTRALLDALIAVEYPARLGVQAGEAGYAAGVGRLQLGILDLVRRHSARKTARRVRVEIPVDFAQPVEAVILPKDSASAAQEIAAVAPEKAEGYASACQERLGQAHIRAMSIRRQIHQMPAYPGLDTAGLLALAWRAGYVEPGVAMEHLQRLYEGHVATAGAPDKEGD